MRESYVQQTLDYFKNHNTNNLEDYLKRLYFIYPTLHIDPEVLSNIIKEANEMFEVPFYHIKVIGSKHQGFSFIDKNKNGKIKYADDKSDIDLAIINSTLFNKLVTNTLVETENFKDRTKFLAPRKLENGSTFNYIDYYQKNLSYGFIRPDSLGSIKDRRKFKEFSKEIKGSYGIKCSIAVYLNEISFITRLNQQIMRFYEMEEVKNGLK